MLNTKPNHKAIVISIIFSVAGYILTYMLNVILAKNLAPHAYGDIYIVLQVIVLCSFIGVFGTNTTVVKYLSQYYYSEKKSHAHGYFRWNLKFVLWLTLALTLVGALVATVFFILTHLNVVQFPQLHPVIFSFWLIPLYVYTLLFSKIMQATTLVNLSIFTMNIALVALQIIFILLFTLIFHSITLYEVLYLVGVSQLVILTFQFVIIKRQVNQTVASTNPEYDKKSWLTYSVSMFWNNITVYAAGVAVLLVLEMIGKNEDEVGVFAAISTICGILFVLNGAIKSIFEPRISAEQNNLPELQVLVNKATIIKTLLVGLTAILIAIFAKPILYFFNPGFVHYAFELRVLVIGFWIGINVSMSSTLLLFIGKEKLEVYSNIFYLCAAIALAFILIPKLQILGAIYADLISVLLAYAFDFVALKFASKVKVLVFI